MPVGACKDRLADAIERFGRVPIVRRSVVVRPGDPALRGDDQGPTWASGGLIHDSRWRVLLLRHRSTARWGEAWVTPGGGLEEGETTVDGLLREVREEVGLELVGPRLTRIFNETVTDGARVHHAYFAQFVARAASEDVRPAPDVRETAWFEELPPDLAFREDYVDDFHALRATRY